jgi:hypothetical protein
MKNTGLLLSTFGTALFIFLGLRARKGLSELSLSESLYRNYPLNSPLNPTRRALRYPI